MLFKNITILDEDLNIKTGMNVGVQGKQITYIGSELPADSGSFGETIDGRGKLLMSGFYNAHAHSPMALMRGYGENLALQDWLMTRIFPFEDKLTGSAVYWGTMLCMAESLRYGIVSTSDMYYFVSDMARAVEESGAKNNISRSLVNPMGADYESMESVAEMKAAVRDLQGAADGRIIIEASLHAEYTNDEKTARALAEYAAAENLGMHVHISETQSEHEECKERHGGRTPVQFLADCGLFDTRSLAAHCVWIEGEDFDILKDKGVTVVTNPISNLKLASGICDSSRVLKSGINLAIGTDSVASNNNLDFLSELKTLALLGKVKAMDPTVVTPRETLYAATRGGALAQGRTDCGLLKEGYRADLIMLDTSAINMAPVHDLVNNLVYSADAGNILMTMVDGKILYKDGEYVTIDKEKTIEMVQKETEGILAQL